MKTIRHYASLEDYISHANVANQNDHPLGENIFDEAIMVLEHMKNLASGTNVVDLSGAEPSDITPEEYDELIEWLSSLDKTKH